MDKSTFSVLSDRRIDWQFWFIWVIASTVAILLGFGLMYAVIFIAKAMIPGVNEDRLAGAIMFPLLAISLGVSQWLVLRTRVARAGWWILATSAGFTGVFVLGAAFLQAVNPYTGSPRDTNGQLYLLTMYVLVGLLLALVQLPVLWRHISSFPLWLLASSIGWLVLGLLMGPTIDRMSDIVALGAVPAAFTGFALVWLIRTPQGNS